MLQKGPCVESAEIVRLHTPRTGSSPARGWMGRGFTTMVPGIMTAHRSFNHTKWTFVTRVGGFRRHIPCPLLVHIANWRSDQAVPIGTPYHSAAADIAPGLGICSGGRASFIVRASAGQVITQRPQPMHSSVLMYDRSAPNSG
jgi:hypothetical protein